MASITLTIDVPDTLVPLARRTLAAALGEPVATTAVETRAQIERYLKHKLKSDASQQRQLEMTIAALTDDTDGFVSW